MATQAVSSRSNAGLGSRRASSYNSRSPRYPSAQDADKTPQGAETLFSHSSVKIVCFSAPGPQRQSSASSITSVGSAHGGNSSNSGTLPWRSRTERVISVGPLRLYRVPGSVVFLHSGALLLSLLPRSQCWCVDGQSKFALRVQEMIYRIELPYENEGEKAKIEDLKEVLKDIIQYEKTACPFKRGFHVELPEEPDSPHRRVLVAPAAKGQRWEHDDTWKPEAAEDKKSDGMQQNSLDVLGSTDAAEDGLLKETAKVIEEQAPVKMDQELVQKPSREYIIEARPEPSGDLRKSSKGRSIQAAAGFVAEEASRISKMASGIHTDASDFPSPDSTLQSPEPESDYSPPTTGMLKIDKMRHTSANVDKTPLETVSKLAEMIEESNLVLHTTSPVVSSTISDPISPARDGVPSTDSTSIPIDSASEPVTIPANASIEGPITDILTPTEVPSQTLKTQPTSQPESSPDRIPTPPAVPAIPAVPAPHALSPDKNGTVSAIEESQANTSKLQTPRTPPKPSLRRRGSSHALRHARSRNLAADDDLTSSLISRAFAILLGPPSGLVAIMMQIARRVLTGKGLANGAQVWRLGLRRARVAKMPGRWVDSEEEESGDDESDDDILDNGVSTDLRTLPGGDEDWDSLDEDDYGVSLSNRQNDPVSLFPGSRNRARLRARKNSVDAQDDPD